MLRFCQKELQGRNFTGPLCVRAFRFYQPAFPSFACKENYCSIYFLRPGVACPLGPFGAKRLQLRKPVVTISLSIDPQ